MHMKKIYQFNKTGNILIKTNYDGNLYNEQFFEFTKIV